MVFFTRKGFPVGAFFTIVQEESRRRKKNKHDKKFLFPILVVNFLFMLSKSEVKYIQSLHQKKFRDNHGVFVAEGPKVVAELIDQHIFPLKKIYAIESWFLENGASLQLKNEQVSIVKDHELEKISFLTTPNQVLAIFGYRSESEFSPNESKVTLMLEEIRDPGNFGTIIRTADWFGINDIVCSVNCVDMYNPKVVQSTMASLGRVNVFYTSLSHVLDKFSHLPLYATALTGQSLNAVEVKKPSFLLIGNEGSGVSPKMLERADKLLTIPGEGGAESLNAAVATGILLYAFTRFR